VSPRRKAPERPVNTAALFDRTPPQSIDAERSVLGAMLLNPNAVGAAIEILRESASETFYVEAHQRIYEAAVSLFKRNMPVDPVTLMEQLSRDGLLDAAGGASYIADLTGAVPTSANIEYYARLVLESAILRRVITTCTRIAGEAYQPEGSVEELLDRAEAEIFAVAEQRQVNPIYRINDLLEEGIKQIEEQIKTQTGVTGVATGFAKLDELLSGLQKSDMVILAARPSVGKTALALNIAAHVTTDLKMGALLFSLEMSKEQLVKRLLCMVGHVDSQRLRTGFLAREEFPSIQRAAGKLSQAQLFIDESASINVLELRSKARRHAAQHPIDLLIIDYLQLMSSGARGENRQVEIAEISRAVKGLARELKIPVLALSQLSREAEKDDSGIPKLSHLRESGAIEQDADVVLMLSRPKAYESEGRDNVLRLDVAKQRNGPTGFVELLFEKNYQRFRSLIDGASASPPPEAALASSFQSGDYEEDDMAF
jgi:replicative DNA helicase